jgi:hypothetical protein
MKLKEEMIGNSAGSGAIDGIGIGPRGEPGLTKPRPVARRGKMFGRETFIVSSSTFNSIKHQKKKGMHWKRYLEEDDAYYDLREYAKKKGPIIIEDERTGACMYVRYGDI